MVTPSGNSQQTGGRRILVVDDDADTVDCLTRLLTKCGYVVESVRTADAAVAAARGEGFDLLICDIGLPGCDGWQLLRRILQERPIRGIALSGYAREQDIQQSMEAGYLAHLTKPVDFARLREEIGRALTYNADPGQWAGSRMGAQ